MTGGTGRSTLGAPACRPMWAETSTFAVLALLATALTATPDGLLLFRHESGRLAGEPWRLVTGHLTHLGATHLAANLLALALLAWIASLRRAGWAFAAGTILPAAAVSAGLVWGPVHIGWYAGMSGILYGLFAQESLQFGTTPRARRTGWALYLAGLIKILLDLRTPSGSIGALGIPVAPPAHLYGYLGGTLSLALAALQRRPGR